MATRWKKATGTSWNTAANWASSVGGVDNAGVPTSSDDVVFSSTSSACTLDVAGSCLSLNFTDGSGNYTGTFTHGALDLAVYGNLTLASGMTYTITNIVSASTTFKATATGKTITTAGKTTTQLIFDGVGGGWTLQDNTTASFRVTVTNGSFNSNGKAITTQYFEANNSNTKTITLSNSTLTLTGTSLFSLGQGAFYISPTGTTLTANSCNITANGTITTAVSLHFAGGVYGNFTMSNITGAVTLLGTNTASFTFGTVVLSGGEGGTSAGIVLLNENMQCINFSPTGASAISRLWIRSTVRGVQRTIIASAGFYGAALYGNSNYIDWQDIVPAGTSTPTNWGSGAGSNTSYGDAGNNGANFTFTVARTLYAVSTGGNWDSTATWSNVLGSSAATRNAGAPQPPPLPQDTAKFDGFSGGNVTTHWYILLGKHLDFSGFTGTWIHTANQPMYIFGNLTLVSGMTITSGTDRSLYFHLTGSLTSGGKTIACPVYVDSPSGAQTLADAYVGSSSLNLVQGTITATAASISVQSFSSSNSYTRALTLGSNTMSVTGSGTVWEFTTTTGLTFTCGTSTVDFTDATATAKTINLGDKTFYIIRLSGVGTGSYTFTQGFTANTLTSTKTNAYSVIFGWFTHVILTTWGINGSSGNVVTISSNAGLQHVIDMTSSPNVTYLNLSYSIINPSGNVTNGTDSGNNANWFFTAPSTKKLLMLMGVGT